MSRHAFALSAIVVLLAPAAGQAQTAQPQADDPAKTQVFMYEMALRSAVEVGGQKLAQQALVMVPGVPLAASEQPIVRGVKVAATGVYLFDVLAPDIKNLIVLWDMVKEIQPDLAPRGPIQSVAGRPAALGGTVTADPMDAAAATPFNPDRAYTAYVREALIDAMLDSSAVLPITATETLTIVASGMDTNPLYRSRKLVLTIKGSDLVELRQGRLTREQAKERIVEARF